MTTKFSQFPNGGDMRAGDKTVGLRDGQNYEFSFPGTGIQDADGNYIFSYSSSNNAVNYLNYQNADTGQSPEISTQGQDATINFDITTKGNGNVNLNMGTGNFVVNNTVGINQISDDDTFASATNTQLNTSLSTKTYIDNVAGAISDSTFITKTDETADLPNSIPLSGLSSGFLSSTTATGELNPRTITGTANQITATNGDGVSGNPTLSLPSTLIAPGTLQVTTSLNVGGAGATITSISTDGTMTANSDALAPTQKSVKTYADSVGGGSVTLTNAGVAVGTTSLVNDGVGPTLAVKGIVGSGNIQATTNATDTTLAFTGTLPIINGGTNSSSAIGENGTLAQSDGSKYTFTTSTYPSTAGTLGTVLRSNGTNWVNSTSTFADTYSIGSLLTASTANTVVGLTKVNNATLVTNSSGEASLLALGLNQVLIGKSGSAPTAITLGFSTGLDVAVGPSNWTISLSVPVSIANGGTNTTSAIGANGTLAQSDGSKYTFTTSTYPSTAGTSGNALISDGTNWASVAKSYGYIWMNTANWTGVSFSFTTSYQEMTSLGTNFTLASTSNDFAMTTDGRLKYTGSTTKTFMAYVVFFVNNGGSFAIQLYKNGSGLTGAESYAIGSQSVAISGFPVSLATNDYLSVFAKRSSAVGGTITQISLSARSV